MSGPERLVLRRTRSVERGVDYLTQEQTAEGPWYGRWGVNYVYGTSGVLRALETIALSAREYCQRAVAWLRAVQNEDGGFGESIASYYDPKLKGQGSSTPSQTAWGLIGLLAATEEHDPAVEKAVQHLLRAAECRRFLGRTRVYRDRLPGRLLSEISSVSKLFSAVRAVTISQPIGRHARVPRI